jgi:DnaK suppressor protein
MDTIDLQYFRDLLEAQIEELLKSAKGTVVDFSHQDSTHADFLDRASYDEERNRIIRFRDRESTLIRKIKLALDRIEEGTYGICETCGGEIGLKRLKARPVATKCIRCKIREEELEKMAG